MKMEYQAVSEGITHVVFTATPEEGVEHIDLVPNYRTGNIDVLVANKTCGSFHLTPTHAVKYRRDADPIVPPEPYRAMQEDEIEDECVGDFITKKTVILISEDAPTTRIVDTDGGDMVLAGHNIHFIPEEKSYDLELVCLVNFSVSETTKTFLQDALDPSIYDYIQWLVDNNYAEYLTFDVTFYEANA